MPNQTPRACMQAGCPKFALPDKWLCADHVNRARKEYDARRQNTAMRKLYNGTPWAKLRAAVISLNPLCQLIEDNGQQCRRPSHAVHHLIDHDGDPAIFFDWAVLVGICDAHHSNSPGETRMRDFVPTIGMLGSIYPHASRRPLPPTEPAPSYTPKFYVSAYPHSQSESPPTTPAKTAQVKPTTAPPIKTGRSWGEQ